MPKKKKQRKSRPVRRGIMNTADIPMICYRCGRHGKVTDADAHGWNITVLGGAVVLDRTICPDCQTPEENAEAAVREATLTYGAGPDGMLGAWPKDGES